MANLTMAVSNVGLPTPTWMKSIFKGLLYLSGLWAIIVPLATNIPPSIQATIDHWIVIGLAVLRFTISFFHYDLDETSI